MNHVVSIRSDIGSGRVYRDLKPDPTRKIKFENWVGFSGLGSSLELNLWASEFVR